MDIDLDFVTKLIVRIVLSKRAGP